MSSPPPFVLQLLGSPELRGPAGPVGGRAAHRRRIALLAILALARGRAVGRERLIGLLWPEHDGAAARHSLSESLYVLRKAVGDGITASGDEVRLDPDVVGSDVAEFEAAVEAGDAERAARAYGGPLLEGFYVADAPEFERWAEVERDRLARAYTRTLEGLAEAAEAEGSAVRAVDWWRALAAHDPFSSRVALRLVRALDAAGERAAALRCAEAHAALLREELGVEREPELEAVAARLRAEPVRTPAPPPPPRLAAGPSASASPASSPRPLEPTASDPPSSVPPASGPNAAHRPGADPAAASSSFWSAAAGGAGDTERSADAARSAPAAPLPPPPSMRGRARRRMRIAVRLAAAAGIAAGLALAPRIRAAEPDAPGTRAAAELDPRRIAVLYFDDHSPGESLRYLASGLTESLIHELAQVEALEVISRNGVKPFRDAAVPLDSITRALRVGSIVEGSLQQSGDSVWVTVQLIEAAGGAHLDSRVVGAPMGDVVALQRAVAQEVAASLRHRLGQEVRLRRARRETASPQALARVLRAEALREDAGAIRARRDPLDAGSARALLLRADSLLAAASDADPEWARPRLLGGWVAMELATLPGADADALSARAVRAADRVLARAPGDAGALELRGFARFRGVVRGGGAPGGAAIEAAERDLRAAVAADPSLASAWSRLSQLLRYRGRFAEADLAARRALEEDAWLEDAADVMHRLYASGVMLEDLRAAAEWCDRGRARFPADWRFTECRLTLLRDDRARPPDPALAWRLVAELERLDPPPRARAQGRAYSPVYRRMVAAALSARAGDEARARAELARARREVGDDAELRVSLAFDEAYLRLLLGEREAARRLLDQLVAARPALRDYVRRDPLFAPLFPR